ncbi:hypothetical protein DDE19_17670 [Micromonospora ureilytica]|uniref:Uncharacterized protein n=1 Tax=Micromonospora ureilytica TaxID=709868 RepID=A0A3N9XSR4_9ACTN|nr:hypothetical protein [Micromonospora ureilytica]RQX15842.1 hypothetical protein DDE19_17670 [Micromonospora ureilytica]
MTGLLREVKTGDVLRLTCAASVQFMRPIFVSVIRPLDWPTYDGWLWIDAYELGKRGDAIARRTLFVMTAGLVWQDPPTQPGRKTARRPVARKPMRVG